MKKKEDSLEKALDDSLDELIKAADGDTISKPAVSEDLKKGEEAEEMKGEKDDEDEDEEPEDAKGGKPDFLKKKKKDDEDDDEDEDSKGDEEEEAMRGGYRKSVEGDLSKSETVSNAIEVSKFLRDLTKSLSEVVGDLKHRIVKLEKSNHGLAAAIVKSSQSQVEIIKSMGDDLSTMGGRPLARKSVDVSKIKTLEKGFRNNGDGDGEGVETASTLTKSQVADKLGQLEMDKAVPFGTTTRYEMTGDLKKSFEKLVYENDKK